MTLKQIQWARQHDWFMHASTLAITVRDDMIKGNALMFTDFDKLYIWAGY